MSTLSPPSDARVWARPPATTPLLDPSKMTGDYPRIPTEEQLSQLPRLEGMLPYRHRDSNPGLPTFPLASCPALLFW